MRKTKSPEPPVVVTKSYDFVLWLAPKIEKFPRSLRFSVGERLLASSLDLLLLLVQAAYASGKERWLDEASQKTNAIRYLLRLSKDLRLLPVESYGFASERLQEIGRMIGGWQKASRRRDEASGKSVD